MLIPDKKALMGMGRRQSGRSRRPSSAALGELAPLAVKMGDTI